MEDPRRLKAEIISDARCGMRAKEIAQRHHVGLRTVYRHLGGRCVRERRQRGDSGGMRKAMEAGPWLELLALVDGDGLAPAEALKVLEANGRVPRGWFTPGWVNSRLRDWQLRKEDAARNGPAVYRRREASRPNASHQCDATPLASVFLDTSQDIIYDPPDPLKKIDKAAGRTRISVFQLVDDQSRAVYLRVYDGETFENWMDFLWRAWARKPHAEEFPFCGLPRVLRCDNGSGLVCPGARAAMREIGVALVPHEPGQSWKKGKAERANRTFQQIVQPLTRRMVFKSFDELNLFLERGAIYLNNRRHGTTGEAPFARWLRIEPAKLILPPTAEDWQRLILWEEEARINPDLTIRFGRGSYHEVVELEETELLMRYRGKRVKVLYARWAEDPIILRLQALAGVPARELRVPRVRPGMRPPSQLGSNLTTTAELTLRAARAADLSHLNLTAHLDEAVELHPVPQPGGQITLNPATMFRPAPVTRFQAVGLGQQAQVFAVPPTPGDEAFLEELFAGAETLERETFDAAIAELGRVKKARTVVGGA